MQKVLNVAISFLGIILLGVLCAGIIGSWGSVGQKKVHADVEGYSGLWSEQVDESDIWSRGTGTSMDPYIISSAENLAYLAQSVNAGTDYVGVYFQVASNTTIDLSGHYWEPIGSENAMFRGTFWGNRVTIENMYIDATQLSGRDTVRSLGLFGWVENNGAGGNQAVNQIVFDCAGIFANENVRYAGVLAGYYNANSLANITVTSTSFENDIEGALIEFAPTDDTLLDDFSAGGLVGYLGSATTLTAADTTDYTRPIYTNIYSSAVVPGGNSQLLGGLVGENQGSITTSYRSGGLIQAYFGIIGGIAGRSMNGTITNVYNAGNIEIVDELPGNAILTSSLYETVVGGLVGRLNSGTITRDNLFNEMGVSANSTGSLVTSRGSIGGLVGINQGVLENLTNSSAVSSASENSSATGVTFMGGIAGVNGGSVVSCTNNGIVGGIDDQNAYLAYSIGGIVGLNDDNSTVGNEARGTGRGSIIASQNLGQIGRNIDASNAGGIAGINSSSSMFSITSNQNQTSSDPSLATFGTVVGPIKNTASISGLSNVGGIVGWNFGSIFGAYNTGTVAGAIDNISITSYVGGIIGRVNDGIINQTFNIGNVTSGVYSGGIAGYIAATGAVEISNCVNYGNVWGSMYAGGLAGRVESATINYVLSLGDVEFLTGSNLNRGGLIGTILTNTNLRGFNDVGYSTSIANYVNDASQDYDNGISTVGNYSYADRDFNSYFMVLPGIAENESSRIYSFYDGGANADWYFAPANVDNDTYYYPVLSFFRSGGTNSLGVFPESTSTAVGATQIAYPSVIIHTVNEQNLYPTWNGSMRSDEVQAIGTTQYIIEGQFISEPVAETEYNVPAGFTGSWVYESGQTINAEWSYDQPIMQNMVISRVWTEAIYTVRYFIEDATTGEFVEYTADDSNFTGMDLPSEIVFSLDPNAQVTLTEFVYTQASGYDYFGWLWSITELTPDDISRDTVWNNVIPRNTVFTDGIVYIYGYQEPKQIEVELHPGYDATTGTAMNFTGLAVGVPRTIQVTYGTRVDWSLYESQLVYDEGEFAFKGWFTAETGGNAVTDTNSQGLYAFNFTNEFGVVQIFAQWTSLWQTVLYVSIDNDGTEHTLYSDRVQFETSITSIPNLLYYVEADRAGYQVDGYYIDANLVDEFDFQNSLIVDTTKIYVTWQKRVFNLILNADSGRFADGTDELIIPDIEYQTDILTILRSLGLDRLPTREGFRIDTDAMGRYLFSEQANSGGLIIDASNFNNLMPAHNYTVYIMWDRERYQIELRANGGRFYTDDNTEGYTTLTISLLYGVPLADAIDNYLNENYSAVGDFTQDVISYQGYGFKYWSLTSDLENSEEISYDTPVPAETITVYAIWSRQFAVYFKRLYNDDSPWRTVYVLEGEQVTQPELDDGMSISGLSFTGNWYRVIGADDDGTPQYSPTEYDFASPIYTDITLCAGWVDSGEALDPVDTSTGMIIAIVIIAVVVVILFVLILVRGSRSKKVITVNPKKIKDKDLRAKIERIQDAEQQRNENPFDDEF